MVKRVTIGLFLFMLSLSSFALTRESVRRDTLRINALELKEIDITSAEEKPKQITSAFWI